MAIRKGLGRGRGKGYRNIIGRDPRVHSDSSRGRKQPQILSPILSTKIQLKLQKQKEKEKISKEYSEAAKPEVNRYIKEFNKHFLQIVKKIEPRTIRILDKKYREGKMIITNFNLFDAIRIKPREVKLGTITNSLGGWLSQIHYIYYSKRGLFPSTHKPKEFYDAFAKAEKQFINKVNTQTQNTIHVIDTDKENKVLIMYKKEFAKQNSDKFNVIKERIKREL